MALTQQQLADLATWVDQYAAQTQALSAQASTATAAAYAGVNMYSATAVAAASAQAADVSDAAALIAAGLASQYLAIVTADMVGASVGIPNLPLPPLRNGVDMRRVFERVAKLYRRQVAKGVPADKAWGQALRLAEQLTDYNIRLAQRESFRQLLTYLEPRLGITGYRRVVHPERSKTGVCGLCLVASDQVYRVGALMPLHARCKCGVAPIIGDLDPGQGLNNLSLQDVYDAAGGTTNGDILKRARFEVNDHGELGPVLTVKGQKFTSRNDIEGYDPSSIQVPDDVRARNQERIESLLGNIDAAMGGSGGSGNRGRTAGPTGPTDPPDDDLPAWQARQDAIGLDFKGDVLKPWEVRSVERLVRLGEQIDWIPDDKATSTPDFHWFSRNVRNVEMKSTKARVETIRTRILDAAIKAMTNHQVVKDKFLIDIGTSNLTDSLRAQLQDYNFDAKGEPRRSYRLARLWVMSGDGARIDEIDLRK